MKHNLTLLMLLAVATAALIFSCSKDDTTDQAPPVSGIFIGIPLAINDTALLQVDLSLDELADGSVNGGLWLTYSYDHHPAFRERVLHHLAFTPSSDGQTVLFTGMASITNPPGELLLSGTITGSKYISAEVTLPNGQSVSPVLYWTGPYLRPNTTKALTTDASDYVGTYPAVWGSCDGQCHGLPLYNGQLVVSEASVNNVGTIDFKGKAIGWYSGCCIEWPFHAGDTLSASLPHDNDADEAEIRGGTLEFNFELDRWVNEMVVSVGKWDPSQSLMITNSILLTGLDGGSGQEPLNRTGKLGPKSSGK